MVLKKRYGRLKIIKQGPSAKNWMKRWWCECSCGQEILVYQSAIVSGHTKSCGCLRKEVVSKNRKLISNRLTRKRNARERDLLREGLTYNEISKATGVPFRSIRSRNKDKYNIDLKSTYAVRLKKAGIPNRLSIDDAFGHYFAGLFDGEGSFLIWERTKNKYQEFCLGLQISLRDDDAHVLELIHRKIGGNLNWYKGHGASNPSSIWRMEKIGDLAEIAIPLFDRFRLHTKKAAEYKLWRKLILKRYIETFGGSSPTKPSKSFVLKFRKYSSLISKARNYK